ncbi:hypothetical protein [Klebsiella grimontii]|uniref:hypothetical protein n=1 Tax=Klebsiella grimontii TaxID=2058152 RepID=UPI0012B95957|nr:hypothetical protein [Klebsiella grimontii]
MLRYTPKITPLTFSPEEIICLQNGHKTQFRRALKGRDAFSESITTRVTSGPAIPVLKCPYGQPGDRIWIRETARAEWQQVQKFPLRVQTGVRYRVDNEYRELTSDSPCRLFPTKRLTSQGVPAWATPVSMPRWASRYLLEVCDTRLEKLCDISETDAYAEGVLTEVWDQVVVARNYGIPDAFFQYWSDDIDHYVEMNELYRSSFQSLWDKLYEAGSWASNPVVWVVTFKLLDIDRGENE